MSRLERRKRIVIPWVFCRADGAEVRDYYTAWRAACKAAGIDRIPHDFRRRPSATSSAPACHEPPRWRWSATRPSRSIGGTASSTRRCSTSAPRSSINSSRRKVSASRLLFRSNRSNVQIGPHLPEGKSHTQVRRQENRSRAPHSRRVESSAHLVDGWAAPKSARRPFVFPVVNPVMPFACVVLARVEVARHRVLPHICVRWWCEYGDTTSGRITGAWRRRQRRAAAPTGDRDVPRWPR